MPEYRGAAARPRTLGGVDGRRKLRSRRAPAVAAVAVTAAWARTPVLSEAQAVQSRRGSRLARPAFDLPSLGDLLGKKDEEAKTEVPKDLAAVAEGLKKSTETVLNMGISRLDIELPPGYKLGVDRGMDIQTESMELNDVTRGDRELARLFVEMLRQIGDGLCIAFRNKKLAAAASKAWKLTPGEGHILAFPERKKGAFATEYAAPGQFMDQLKKRKCDCLLVVAPYLEELRIVSDVDQQVGNQMGIMLLNARIHGVKRKTTKLPKALKEKLKATFPVSYHLRFTERKDIILFKMVAKEEPEQQWILAQQRELISGTPVTDEIWRGSKEPSPKQIQELLDEFDQRDKGVQGAIVDLLGKKQGS